MSIASPFNDLKRSATMSNKPSRPHTSQPSESDLFFESLQHTAASTSSPFFPSTASQSKIFLIIFINIKLMKVTFSFNIYLFFSNCDRWERI